MTMNSSGPISLGGPIAGQSIEVENGGSGYSQISLNDPAVRSLAQVPSGQISMPTNFWGKSNGHFVVFSFQSNRTMVSSNGINWSEGGNLPTTYGWSGGAYGNGIWVITGGTNSTVAYSYDGVNWSGTGNLGLRPLQIAYGNGRFVATTNVAKTGLTSTDGINWSQITFTNNNTTPAGIAFYNGVWLATLSAAFYPAVYSYDGVNWADTDLGIACLAVSGGLGLFQAIQDSSPNVYRSSNGINFTAGSMPFSSNWGCVKANSNYWVASGSAGGGQLAYSYDGVNWGTSNNPSANYSQNSLAGQGNLMCLVNPNNDGDVYHTYDGINWGGSAGLPWNAPQKCIFHGG